jgi:rubrerythrin
METVGFNLDDILDLAIQMEMNGSDFYDLAARSTPGTTARLMLSGLASMEKEHKEALIILKEKRRNGASTSDPDVDAAISGFLKSWLDGDVFDRNREEALTVAGSGAMADVLHVAIRMEKDSIALYTGLKEYAADSEAGSVLDRIIRDELQHVTDLSSAFKELK